ncbi:MAG: hypothetical protein L0Y66_23355 [Myxococcaceae bacterium]|nr:hypothetical protein [Myxococcaceae bacterium]
MRPPASLVTLHQPALPEDVFERLLRAVRRVGKERLRHTYQTTFWFDLRSPPESVVEEAALLLAPHVPGLLALRGVEWWLSRMYATDVRVDFHQDRDERLALAGGPLRHPRVSTILFLNRVRGGALAVTREPPCEDNPSLAPEKLDLTLVAPRPNRFAVFRGDLTHGVLDADNRIPDRPLPGPARLRLTLALNWWDRRPTGVPTFAEAGVYPALRVRRPDGRASRRA